MNTLRQKVRNRGFALVTTLVMMVLLTVLTVGMLSLSAISLRSSQGMEARRIAQSNARVALMMALNELQTQLGDDRRVTADASILSETTAQPNLVGVWRSTPSTQAGDASPLTQPGNTRLAPNYTEWKNRFNGWLVSSPSPESLLNKEFAASAADPSMPELFKIETDGIDLAAGLVRVRPSVGSGGAYAWGVTQEATRAKINVGSDESLRLASNDSIHAPNRPNLALTGLFGAHPRDGWEERPGKILDLNQAALDSGFDLTPQSAAILRKDHTAHSQGVLADVVKGGLKTDLSLGFELSDNAFKGPSLDGFPNPFAGGTAPGGEVPLYLPATGSTGRTVQVQYQYDIPMPIQQFDTGAPPTLNNLRSYYRMYQHMYNSAGGLTAFQRPQASTYYNSATATSPRGSETAVGPVLDRMIFVLSLWQGFDGMPHIVFTPIITLWNPYNVAIESEGFVAYPWMDMPIGLNMNVTRAGTNLNFNSYLSTFMGGQYAPQHGRQDRPYFLCAMTQGGAGRVSPPVVLKPGEVRIFMPSSNRPVIFNRTAGIPTNTLQMRPVAEYEGIDIGGGMAVPLRNGINNPGWSHGPLAAGDTIRATVNLDSGPYHYFVTLEDAGRIKGSTRINKIAEVQLYKGKQGALSITSPSFPQASLARQCGQIQERTQSAIAARLMKDINVSFNRSYRVATRRCRLIRQKKFSTTLRSRPISGR